MSACTSLGSELAVERDTLQPEYARCLVPAAIITWLQASENWLPLGGGVPACNKGMTGSVILNEWLAEAASTGVGLPPWLRRFMTTKKKLKTQGTETGTDSNLRERKENSGDGKRNGLKPQGTERKLVERNTELKLGERNGKTRKIRSLPERLRGWNQNQWVSEGYHWKQKVSLQLWSKFRVVHRIKGKATPFATM